MNCYIDGCICPQGSLEEVFPGLQKMVNTCKFCQKTNEDGDLPLLLEELGVNSCWFDVEEGYKIPADLRERILETVDDVLEQGVLLKKLIIHRADDFLSDIEDTPVDYIRVKRLFDENKWWLEHIIPQTLSSLDRDNITCKTLIEAFVQTKNVANWSDGGFFTSGIEIINEIFKELEKLEEA